MSEGMAKIGASALPSFRVGDRIRLSEVGELRTPRTRVRTGKVVRIPKANEAQSSIEVLFDGNKTPTRIHKAYVEIDSPAGQAGAESEEMSSGAWSPAEDEQLQKLASSGISLKAIALEMGRGTSSVRSRAIKLNIAIALDRNSMQKGPSVLSKLVR